jgi:hypothetical protein
MPDNKSSNIMKNNDGSLKNHQQPVSTTSQVSTFNLNEPSNEHKNGYRLMCCLIDVCPKYFKKRLLFEISDKDEYNKKINEAVSDKLEDESENKIHKEYVKALEDSTRVADIHQAIENFCFSLCLVFFEFILKQKWSSIYELRKIRDLYYGHALGIGKSSKNVSIDDITFNELKEIIITNLCRMVPDEEENIHTEIEEICKRIIVNNEEEYIRKIKVQCFFEYSQKILKNGKLPNGKELSEENFHHYMIDIQEKDEFHSFLNKRMKLLEKDVEDLKKKNSIVAPEIGSTTINEINELLKNKQRVSDSFLILILIGFKVEQNTDFFEFLKNIASFDCWNLIMNFMHNESHKIYDALKPQNREFKSLALKELSNHSNDTNEEIFEKCFFLKCEITNDYEEMENQMKDFETYLNRLFKQSTKTIDFNTVTFMGDSKFNFNMDTLYDTIQAVIKYSKKRINNMENLKNYILSFSNEKDTHEYFTREFLEKTKILNITTDITYFQLLENLSENRKFDDPLSYYLPAKSKDKCRIERETLNKFKSNLLVYHWDFGNKEYEIENKDKSIKKEILKKNFLKGENLIPKVLWLNEIAGDSNEERILIERTVEKQIIEVFYKNNEPGEIWKKPDEFFKINHARSAGGTTLSRSILFKLRKYFICLELLKLDQEKEAIIDFFKNLKKNYKNYLLIMIEQDTLNSFSWTEYDLSNFQRKLANTVDKNCKILYTCRDNKIYKSDFGDFKADLSTKLDRSEKDSLSNIYPKDKHSSSEFQFQSDKIHLYPLYYFNEEFEKIDNIIESCFAGIHCEKHDIFSNKECFNCKLKLILFLMCMTEKLTNTHLNKESIALIVSKEDGNSRIDNLFKYYNDKDLNVLTEVAVLHDKKSIKLAHSCLGNKFLNKLQNLDEKLKTNKMRIFGEKILELVKEQTSNKEFKIILFDLLIKIKKNIPIWYKINECKNRLCKDNSSCENYHYSHERRRPWNKDENSYYGVSKCDKVFINGQWVDQRQCRYSDKCKHCHTENEFEYHPEVKNYFTNHFLY